MPEESTFDRLADALDVFRTVTRARDFSDGRALAGAFFRRAADKKGLSVDFNVEVPAGCAAQLDPTSKRAVLKLQVLAIRSTPLGLDVIPDALTHGNIVGVPFYDDEAERLRAEQIAAKLVEVAEVVWAKSSTTT
jgi:hypothetical protein